MEQHLVPVPPDRSLAQLAETVSRAQDYAQRAKAPRTRKAYAADWRHFTAWADARGLTGLPATVETVAFYLADMAEAGAEAATIARRLVVISQAHRTQNLPSPTTSSEVRNVHAGIRRTHGTAQEGKAPATVEDIKTMLDKFPHSRLGHRDRALLLLGFAGAFRRSELVRLEVADLDFTRAGLIVTLRRVRPPYRLAVRNPPATPCSTRTQPPQPEHDLTLARCELGGKIQTSPGIEPSPECVAPLRLVVNFDKSEVRLMLAGVAIAANISTGERKTPWPSTRASFALPSTARSLARLRTYGLRCMRLLTECGACPACSARKPAE